MKLTPGLVPGLLLTALAAARLRPALAFTQSAQAALYPRVDGDAGIKSRRRSVRPGNLGRRQINGT
jgi:outer membrane protein TolC